MGNTILNFGSVATSAPTKESLIRYKDIDIDAAVNNNYKGYTTVYLSDYIRWLNTNDGYHIQSSVASQLSNVLLENQRSIPEMITDENEDEVLSAIALVVKDGYDIQKNLYYRYTDPYRWKIAKLVNVKAVENSLKNIFSWIPGERIINPEFGSNLRIHLYEGITPENNEAIMAEIRQCVSKWEPRANITRVVDVSQTDETEDNTVHLKIYYTIPSLSDEEYEYSYYYDRG